MRALHRLKAYFGMVPAEEFDDYHFGYDPDYDDPEYHVAPAHPARECDHVAAHAAPVHAGAPTLHPSRPPSLAAPSRTATTPPRTAGSWAADAPVRGSLAIDTASTAGRPAVPASPGDPFTRDLFSDDGAHPLSRIVTLHPHNYNEARPIGERYREGNPVIMNLTGMEDRDAKRLVDFAAGLAFALRGSIDKVTNKVFLLSPPNVDVSAEDRRRIAEGRFPG
ncbi:MAG TPA: cell division protein SepF [Pseudonocardiaceae bacterium]|nr:cell division protein SepF [Pseudonocardiaceae bacterium]